MLSPLRGCKGADERRDEARGRHERARAADPWPTGRNEEQQPGGEDGDPEAQHLPVIGIAEHRAAATDTPPRNYALVQQDDEGPAGRAPDADELMTPTQRAH